MIPKKAVVLSGKVVGEEEEGMVLVAGNSCQPQRRLEE